MIIAAFKNGETKVYTKSAHQFDKGQKLLVTGIALPDSYEIHMSNQKDSGMAYSCIGKIDGVTIPDALFVSGEYIYVWLYATSVEHEDTDAYGYSLGPDESLTEVPIEGKTIEEITYITEEDYFNLQNLIRVAIGNEPIKEEKPDPNEDPRVTRLKKKFRERDKLVSKAKQKKGDVLKFDECLAAICCMGIGLTPLNIGELSYSAISTLLKTYQSKEAFDSSTMGAMFGTIDTKKTKIEYWIGNSNN